MQSVGSTRCRIVDGCGIRRIEAAVDAEYTISQRWHELMSFQREGRMRAYTPDGRDAYLYARIRQTQPQRYGAPRKITSRLTHTVQIASG